MSSHKPFPVAPKRPHELTQHGVTRIDDYYWMRDKDDPETMKYLHAESDYLEETMQHTHPLREALFSEMKGRIQETDATVPEKRGDFFYYERSAAGRQYPIFCRKKGSLESPEEVILDQNELAEGRSFCSISGISVSPDGTKLAYLVDFGGREVYEIYIKDLVTGKYFPEIIGNISGSAYERFGVDWANDSQTIFYVTLSDTQRSDKLFRHSVGSDPKDDVLVFHEADEAYYLFCGKTRDDKYIITYHYSTNTREYRFMDADDPASELRVLQPRVEGLDYSAAHHKGRFFIVNNHNAKNFKVSVAPVDAPGIENWRDILPHREDVLVEYVDTFDNFIVVHERKGGLKQIRISDEDGLSNVRYVKFPEPTYSVFPEGNSEFETDRLRAQNAAVGDAEQ
ncbi:MAG TPA: hypothetical protein PKI78_08555, partial [Anaerolineales bacterium]|nr:hypothetical protein [Anaerolineales bacterium]